MTRASPPSRSTKAGEQLEASESRNTGVLKETPIFRITPEIHELI